MWSETWSLDTYFYLYENLIGAPLHWNDDNANAIIVAVSNGVITTPIGGGYNSALIGVELEPGTYQVEPGSYNNAGTGDYRLKVTQYSD